MGADINEFMWVLGLPSPLFYYMDLLFWLIWTPTEFSACVVRVELN